MDISLTYGLNTSKLFSSRPSRRSKFNAVSCRATTQFRTGGTNNSLKMLSLDSNASVDEIKKAYRNMALRYHPDVCDPSRREESTRMFVELHEAYRTLIDQTSDNECSLNVGMREKRNGEGHLKDNWTDQLSVLNRRSSEKIEQKHGSWGSRMRAQPRHA